MGVRFPPRTLADILQIPMLVGGSWGGGLQGRKEGRTISRFCLGVEIGRRLNNEPEPWELAGPLSRHHLWADTPVRCIRHTFPTRGC